MRIRQILPPCLWFGIIVTGALPACGDDASHSLYDCDPESPDCVLPCRDCKIDGWCYTAYQQNPLNPCQVCDASATATSWTNHDGSACDDGLFCNGADSCLDGACTVHDGDPCGDDGVLCNGEERCDEEQERCEHGGDLCGEGYSCNAETDECCVLGDDQACGENGNVRWIDSCGREGTLAEECLPAPQGACYQAGCICGSAFTGPGCQRCRLYVSAANGDDGFDGSSWTKAFYSIHTALAAAAPNECEVWVAEGTYRPSATDDPSEMYNLPHGVHFYGGFAGTERLLSERDLAAHPTVLTGELGDPAVPTDNSCTLVVAGDRTVVDGFTLRDVYQSNGRNACQKPPQYWQTEGGALFASDPGVVTEVTVRNCRFENNQGDVGASIFVEEADLHLSRTAFVNNRGGYGAALVFNQGELTMSECLVEDNVHEWSALVQIFDPSAGSTISHSRFVNNLGEPYGHYTLGVFHNHGVQAPMVLSHCLFFGNDMYQAGALATSVPLALRSCTIVGNHARCTNSMSSGGILAHENVSLMNSIIWGNTTDDLLYTVAEQNLNGIVDHMGARYSILECDTPACLPMAKYCDSIRDCAYGSDDHESCGTHCAAGEFLCRNYSCVPLASYCDGVDDCGDDSDELGCGSCAAGEFACTPGCIAGDGVTYADPQLTSTDATTFDLRVQAGSPAVDAGLNVGVWNDVGDLDHDGDVAEMCPVDLDGQPRVQGARVDIGAYERP